MTIDNALTKPAWWKESAVYQIYPSSFKDDNNDGMGDLKGITSKLDYIKSLGVDVVWLSPMFKSPDVDMGYDISDYQDVDPKYGTLEDLDELTKGLHDRGMKLMLDLVVNHTSDQHEWFKESSSSKTNPKRDWYVWRPPRYDENGERQPPTNWAAAFSPSAWEWDETTQEYYLHLFAIEQPDLNWDNPEVREAVCEDVIRYWFKRGCDGFRLDAIDFISKPPVLEDLPITQPEYKYQPGAFNLCANGPRMHEYYQQMGKLFEEYGAITVGEAGQLSEVEDILEVVGVDRKEFNMIFQFDVLRLWGFPESDKYSQVEWTKHNIEGMKYLLKKYQTPLVEGGGWFAPFLENHDNPRSVAKFFPYDQTDAERVLISKLLATYQIFQIGTPYVYQGQELALGNLPEDTPVDDFRDVAFFNRWNLFLTTKPTEEEKKVFYRNSVRASRDNSRTPMQWNDTSNAGFNDGSKEPWIKVNQEYKHWNAEKALSDKNSAFYFWSNALALRKEYKDVFVYGKFDLISEDNEEILAYTRESASKKRAAIVLNFMPHEVEYTLPVTLSINNSVVVSNYGDAKADSRFTLRPYESIAILET